MKKILLVVSFCFLIVSCGGENNPKATPTPFPNQPTNDNPHYGPIPQKYGGTLQMNESGEFRSLDPIMIGDTASHHIGHQIYDGLVQFDDELNIKPGLAKSWEFSEDKKTLTFHLRRNAWFHDNPCFTNGKGRRVVAGDFKYSVERLAHPNIRSIGYWSIQGIIKGAKKYRRSPSKGISGIEVVNDFTLKIHLIKPNAIFLQRLTLGYLYVVPFEAVDHYGEDFFQNPVGSGAFIFQEWEPGQKIVLKKNPMYWEVDQEGNKLPYLDEIIIYQKPDLKTQFQEFERGNIDETAIPPEFWGKVITPKKKLTPSYEKFILHRIGTMDIQYYGFFMEKSPLGTNKKLRQAFNYAIDRESILKYVMKRGFPAKGPIPSSMPHYNPEIQGYEYDIKKAKKLLAEAGYPGGEGLKEITLQLNSGGGLNERMAEAIQQQLKEIGVKVNLTQLAWPQHLENVEHGKAEFFRTGWLADYPDPENFLSVLYGENKTPGAQNNCRFENAEFDKLYEEALQTLEQDKRNKLYEEMEKIAIEEAPWLFISYGDSYILVQPRVQNYPVNPARYPIWKYIWLKR